MAMAAVQCFGLAKERGGGWDADCRNAAQCESLGHRPRDRAISDTNTLARRSRKSETRISKSQRTAVEKMRAKRGVVGKDLKGRAGGMPHHFGPSWFFMSRSIFPRAMPWAVTFQAFGPSFSLYDSNEQLLAESVIMACVRFVSVPSRTNQK